MASTYFMSANCSQGTTFIFVQLTRGSNSQCNQPRKCPSTSLRMTHASFSPEMVTRGFNSAEIRVSSRFKTSSEASRFKVSAEDRREDTHAD